MGPEVLKLASPVEAGTATLPFLNSRSSSLCCFRSLPLDFNRGTNGGEREGEVRREVRQGEFGADRCVLAGKLGSKVRTEPPMIPTTRMERTLMWNPHRVLQRRLRVETDWQFIL